MRRPARGRRSRPALSALQRARVLPLTYQLPPPATRGTQLDDVFAPTGQRAAPHEQFCHKQELRVTLGEWKKEDLFRKIRLKSVPFFVDEFHRAQKPAPLHRFLVHGQSSDNKQRPYAKSQVTSLEDDKCISHPFVGHRKGQSNSSRSRPAAGARAPPVDLRRETSARSLPKRRQL
ncbi:hypothetical protein EVAR_41687_1 [Eumeta japonica]|uniref:Uncharacterized protein n=1 Tax=Eumeta variegata TaxID=151549 RepID=A0A4C1VQI0_EUMVA|nr:hypothetical protein EVAR_41687_1 [Eumeta japonica]